MSEILSEPSNDFKKVNFKLLNKNNRENWENLLEIHNDYFLNFIESWVEEFEMSWGDFFTFVPMIEEINHIIEFHPLILKLMSINYENKKIVESFPKSTKVDIEEMNHLMNVLPTKGFKRSLTPTQLRDLVKMVKNKNSANFSVPGAGKTSVMIAKILLNESKNILVFVPNDVVMDAWINNEIVECLDKNIFNDPIRLTGVEEIFEQKLRNAQNEDNSKLSFLFITYSTIENNNKEKLLTEYLLNHDVHIVLDESHKIKSGITRGLKKPGTRASGVLRLGMFGERRDILTGTPMPHGIMDIVSQSEFLYPHCGFREILEINEHNPGKPLQGLFARTTKEDLSDYLPDVNNKKVPVPMGIAQMAFYQTVVDFYTREFRNVPLNTVTKKINKAIKRIIELSVDPYNVIKKIEDEEQNTRLAHFISIDQKEKNALEKVKNEVVDGISNKMKIAIEIAKEKVENNEKVVIWSQFVNPIIVLEKNLKDFGVVTLFGATKNPNEIIDSFNNPKSGTMILISNPQKGGEGISLHKSCHNAIYLDRDYDAAKYLQSRDRIHRIGLENPKEHVVNYYFLESTYPGDKVIIDERISLNLQKKLKHMHSLLNDKDLNQLALDEDESKDFTSPFTEIDLEDSIDWLYS